MDGLALASFVQSDLRLKSKPEIMLVVAGEKEENHAQAAQLGIVGQIAKPLNRHLLLQALQQSLQHSQHAAGAAKVSPKSMAELTATPNLSKHKLPKLKFAACIVLLVEDNEINQQIAVELLEVVGIGVDVANNGLEALQKLNSNAPGSYQLVLMDLEMPKMDGHEATLAIRQDSNFANLPIVALTAHALQTVRERCLAEGMQDHLSKPIHPELLYACLASLLPEYVQTAQAGKDSSAPVTNTAPALSSSPSLPKLPGLDANQGVQNLAGNAALYRQLLQRFMQSQEHSVDQVQQAIQEHRLLDAMQKLHSLRGAAANLGALSLAGLATQLEAECETMQNSGIPVATQSLWALDDAMRNLHTGLAAYFAQEN